MLGSAGELPAFSRLENGSVRVLSSDPCLRLSASRVWGPVRAMQFAADPGELPPGEPPTHVFTLNLGTELTTDVFFEGLGWQMHRTPHHGLGVYPAHVPHALREHNARELLAVEITPEFAATALAECGALSTELRPVIGARDPFAAHVMLALGEELRLGGEAGALRAESLGTALVAHLVERQPAAQTAHVTALSSPKLRRVLDYVGGHLDAPLALRTLAGLVEMDVYRFIRAFKQSTGVSPHRYVLEARINRAKELLKNRALSITEIALETGFATPSHFSVTFRRIVNVTPREYRDSLVGS